MCERRTGEYFVDAVVGPIHYKEFSGLTREEVLAKYPNLKANLRDIRKSFLARDIIIDCYETKPTDEERLEPIHRFYREHGRIPKRREIAEGVSIKEYFKTWNRAIELAGYTPKQNANGGQGPKSKYTDHYLLEQLQHFYQEHGRSPKYTDFYKNPKYPSRMNYYDRFGSWTAALELAGLPLNSTAYTRQELLDIGKSWIAEHGCTPTALDFGRRLPSVNVITKHFESWNAYIVEIGGTLNEGSYGRPTQALDGKTYRSRIESKLADILFNLKIRYEYETPYPAPYHRYYDFYLPTFDVYIELDGMGEARDRDVIGEKIEINRQLGRRLTVLYPDDINKQTVEKLLTTS